MRIPFQERNSRWRGALDLVSGCYPRFLIGGSVGRSIPVFHFHECHPAALEPYLRYLAENGYRGVDCDAVAAFVRRGIHPGPRTVALCFDDAWSTFWLVAVPLLRKYNLTAITFVSPARVPEADAPRPQWDGRSQFTDLAVDRSPVMFATWPELRAIHAEGRVDIQAHSWRHARIAADTRAAGFVAPDFACAPHQVPLADASEGTRLLRRTDLGAPLYATRSRLSDARRWIDPSAFKACTDLVAASGGEVFFTKSDWHDKLAACAARHGQGRWEADAERETAILEELVNARQLLAERLGSDRIRHMCFPWAIGGSIAVSLAERAGYETAYGDRLWGRRSVYRGDPPYQLMRLKHHYIFSLPGQGRSWFFGKKRPGASRGLELGAVPLP